MNHNNHGPAGGDKSPVIAQKALLESASIDMDGESRPLPAKLLVTSREMDSLTAISDTLLPSMDVPPGPYSESMEALYRTSASMVGVPQKLGEYIKSGKLQHLELLSLLRLSLWLLSTWYGTFIFCGTRSMSWQFPYFHKFSDLDHRQREKIILGWSVSFFSLYRQLFRGLKFLIALLYFTQVNETNSNPTWQALGYCGPDPNLVNAAKNDEDQAPLRRSLIYIENSRDTLCATIAQAGLTTTSRPYAGLHKPILTICCDAVVVGSGSGGGLVAGVLAQAGYKVIVLEKGDYHARNSLTLLEGSSMDHMYEASGMLPTSNTNVVILAGATVGGGSAINWSASIRTPDHVMREWRHELGLDLFGSDAYENAMDAVCARMGVQADFTDENLNNAVLRRGCQELGYPVCNIPRNSPPDHHCGWCCFGCRDGRKQGTHETWLVDMAESGNGVILPGCRATKVLYTNKGRRRRQVATGVVFEYANGWSGEKEICMVESKVTIVACGALRTPVLLKQSGLKNPNIGKHLHLHPVAMVWGHFPDSFEGKTSYEGGIMTAMSPVVSSSGYGALIQTPALHPGMFSSLMPWVSGADFKDRMTRFSRTAHVFALARDRGEGTVSSCGAIGYKMGEGDEENLKVGVARVMRILAAAGAAEIGTHDVRGERLDVKRASWHEFEGFVKEVSGRGLRDLSSAVCSAHQMGSCRMGVDERGSVVDERGETWEVEGLFVADASVFPTALGVNPMVTVQAIAYCTAQAVVEVLKRKLAKKKKTKSRINKHGGVIMGFKDKPTTGSTLGGQVFPVGG